MSDIEKVDQDILKSASRFFKMTGDSRFYQHTIWMKDEDYQRMSRLADRLDISKSEVVMAALKLYEELMLAVEAEGFDVSNGRKPRDIAKVEADIAKINQGLVRHGEDVGEPIDPERLRELLGTRPDDCPICAMNNRREFIFEPKK
jgi:predicted transcriptional regulator